MKKKKKNSKTYQIFGKFRIPLPQKTGGAHRPKKGKGSYKRKPKYTSPRYDDVF